MTRGAWAVVLTGVTIWSIGSEAVASRVKQRPSPRATLLNIEKVIAEYADGDDRAVERWLAVPQAAGSVVHVQQASGLAGPWDRRKAAFILEVIVLRPIEATGLLGFGRSMVVGRPDAVGSHAIEDRFEVLWHQSALAVAHSLPDFALLQGYLNALGLRFDGLSEVGPRLETRLPLTRAVAAGIACCWTRRPYELVRTIPRTGSRPTMEAALALFEAAAQVPALRAEALVRGGKLLYEMGRHAQALTWFESVPDHKDQVVGYTQQLTLGRVFDALDRPMDAVAAYEAATRFSTADQRASIGLAAALLRSGRADEASSASKLATGIPEDVGELTPRGFNRGDLRFVSDWILEIRRLRK